VQSPPPAPSESVPGVDPGDKNELRREIVDFLKLVVWFLIIFLTLRAYVVEGYEVQGESMEPTLSTKDRILVFKLPHELSKFSLFSGIDAIEAGDIVVFDSPDNSGKRYVKRVIAAGEGASRKGTVAAGSVVAGSMRPDAGVTVTFDRGEVFVNNLKVNEDYLSEASRFSGERQELVLHGGEYYVLGDNRHVSKDSRSFDAIHDNTIIGKAVLRFWPPTRISLVR